MDYLIAGLVAGSVALLCSLPPWVAVVLLRRRVRDLEEDQRTLCRLVHSLRVPVPPGSRPAAPE